MKSIKFTSIIILLFFSLLIHAQSTPRKVFETGNQFYAHGNFDQAIEAWQKIANSGFESAELYYNLGNAYYRSGKYTFAVYNYEKSKQLNPDNDDLQHNLELANLQITDKIVPLPEFFVTRKLKSLVAVKSADFWAWASVYTFILMLSLILFYLFSKNRNIKQISFFTGLLFLVISVTTFVFARKQKENLTSHNSAVIFSPSVFVKSSPDDNATELFSIHEGLKVDILDDSGDWFEIKLADGKIGWLRKDALKRI
jgi:tetratricopeptide (TPR) repeat protein